MSDIEARSNPPSRNTSLAALRIARRLASVLAFMLRTNRTGGYSLVWALLVLQPLPARRRISSWESIDRASCCTGGLPIVRRTFAHLQQQRLEHFGLQHGTELLGCQVGVRAAKAARGHACGEESREPGAQGGDLVKEQLPRAGARRLGNDQPPHLQLLWRADEIQHAAAEVEQCEARVCAG